MDLHVGLLMTPWPTRRPIYSTAGAWGPVLITLSPPRDADGCIINSRN